MDSNTSNGLVICDITARNESRQPPTFVTPDQLAEAAALFPKPADTRNPVKYTLELTPGSVRLTKRSLVRRSAEKSNYKPRTLIHEWSRKSRANMVARLCSLDYRPLLSMPETMPGLITLTYPGDWKTVAPNGETVKRHLKLFRSRFERRWGIPLRAIWKMEFQRRGACHFHLFAAVPMSEDFAIWLSTSWAEIVGHPDPLERSRHQSAGTGLDFEAGFRATDAKRVATYFSKHNSPNYGSKEYQNQPPAEWQESGRIGRFWGYWHLEPLTIRVAITEANALKVSRMLRRWSRANAPHQRREVFRTCQRTGRRKRRWVTRRGRPRMASRLGFLSVSDGAEMGTLLARGVDY